MIGHLIWKEILICKKYLGLMLITALLIPPFILWRAPEYAGSLSFLVAAPFTVFGLEEYVLTKESQYPKAAALLCATPYPRRTFVESKYGFCFLIYVVCCLLFGLESCVMPGIGKLGIGMMLTVFMGISVFVGLFFPIYFRFGFEKLRYLFVVLIVAVPFLMPQLIKMKGDPLLVKAALAPPLITDGILLLLCLLIQAASIWVSVKIYEQKDIL